MAYRDDGTRVLKEIHLFELSCVPIPAAPRAQITSIKSLSDVQQVLEAISDATAPEVAQALRGINVELKRLLNKGDDDPDREEKQQKEELAMLESFAQELKALRRPF